MAIALYVAMAVTIFKPVPMFACNFIFIIECCNFLQLASALLSAGKFTAVASNLSAALLPKQKYESTYCESPDQIGHVYVCVRV